MKPLKLLRHLSVALATVGLLVPNTGSVLGSEVRASANLPTSSTATKITDVSLADGGTLRGQVVDSRGIAQPNLPVSVFQGKVQVAAATTSQSGEFTISGMSGGVYVVATTGTAGVVRAWAPRTAPPSAVPGVLLVPDGTVRGQLGAGLGLGWVVPLALGAMAIGVIWGVVEHNEGS